MCRLALALGKTLTEIATMSTSEFTTWWAYYLLEPFGCPADDSRTEAQMQLFFSANAEKGTKAPRFIQRWVPDEEPTAAPAQNNQLNNKIKGFFAAYTKKQKAPEVKPRKVRTKKEVSINKDTDTKRGTS